METLREEALYKSTTFTFYGRLYLCSGVDGETGRDAVSAAVEEHQRPAIVDTAATGHAAAFAAACPAAPAGTVQTGQVTG